MGALTAEQLEHFEDEGFLVVEGVLDPETVLDPVIEEYTEVLDRLVHELYAREEISSLFEDLDFGAYCSVCPSARAGYFPPTTETFVGFNLYKNILSFTSRRFTSGVEIGCLGTDEKWNNFSDFHNILLRSRFFHPLQCFKQSHTL